MSDSLRDQLLNAGFKEKEQTRSKKTGGQRKRKNKPNRNKGKSTTVAGHKPGTAAAEYAQVAAREAELAAERKAMKARVKSLINENKIKLDIGETAHNFMFGPRIRQIFVTPELKLRLVAGEVIITRLNGHTCLIPPDTAREIHALNPEWVMASSSAVEGDQLDGGDDYADFPVPDDLQW